jgi:phytoene dehydrogenase-like protein
MRKQTGERAVVLGGSMAGLLAARVLADAYAQVTVVDRDELPGASTHRRGVPQGHHVHGLLARGQQALEELFPGLTAELVAHGVPAGDLLANARLFLSGHRLRQAHGACRAVRQPTGSRGPHPGPGSRAAQREVPGPL